MNQDKKRGAPLKYGMEMCYKKAYLPKELWEWIESQGETKTEALMKICVKSGWVNPRYMGNDK